MSQLPARVMAEEAAWLLGFATHDIPVLVCAGLLKPLGHPPASGTKFFATAALLKLRDDEKWLARASDAIVRHWQSQNNRKPNKRLALATCEPAKLLTIASR
jgi:hypothetical protein